MNVTCRSLTSLINVRLSICVVILLFLAGPPIVTAQSTGIEQNSAVMTVPAGDKFLRWHGHQGRTYFLQASDTSAPLAKWRWATVIERGNDEEISYEVDGTASSGFFRLRYTDQYVAPGEWLEVADFDGDGLVNIDEIDPPPPAAATDPLSRDTDGDGMDDPYERTHGFDGGNPDENGNGIPDGQDDSDGDGLSNAGEGLLGTNPTFEDSDDDGVLDGAEVAAGTDPVEEVKPIRPGTYSVTAVRGQAGPNGLPSVGDGSRKVFYEKMIYSNTIDWSREVPEAGGRTRTSTLAATYEQTCEWTKSPPQTFEYATVWNWTREDHQEGSWNYLTTLLEDDAQFVSSESQSFVYLRDLTPFTSTEVTGTKVVTTAGVNPVTSEITGIFPVMGEGLSVPGNAVSDTPSSENPTRWSRTSIDGDVEESWEIDRVIPWKTQAEESRLMAETNAIGHNSYSAPFIDGTSQREQGDISLAQVSGGRAMDGSGSYEKCVVDIHAEDQAVILHKLTRQWRADDFISADHETVTYQTIQPGQSATVMIEAEPSEGYDHIFVSLYYSVMEIRSRDRGFSGSAFLAPGEDMTLSFRVGSKNYGTFSVTSLPVQESASFIYPNRYRMFAHAETENHDAWKNSQGAMPAEELGALQGVADSPSLPGANPAGFGAMSGTSEDFDPRAISQEVVFWWEGTRLHFASVSDDLGSLEVELGYENKVAPPVRHTLVSEPAFERVIAAAEGLIAGDDPPEIKAWEDYPEPLDEAYPPPPVLTAAQQNDLMASAPPAVMEEFGAMQNQNPAITLGDAQTFFWLVNRTDEEPVFTDDNDAATEEWTAADREAFLLLVATHGYNYSPNGGGAAPAGVGGAAAAGAPNTMAAGWRGTPTTRTELDLPATLRNRGLLTKALRYLIERTVKGQLAYAEGTIFGVWDGIKGDVMGVADTVRMAAGGWDDAAIFIGRYLKDPYRVAAELNATFELVKEITWSGVKRNVKAMVDEMLNDFVGNQEDRLKLVLGDECEDPLYLTAYLAGYTGGFIGEQVGVAFFTAGLSKAGVISQVLRAGRGAVGTLMGKAAAKFPQAVTLAGGVVRTTGEHVQKLSKGFFGEFARTSKSADQARAARRMASLCRTTTGCFAAGTLVAMADGSYRPIENLSTGDRVVSMATEINGAVTHQTIKSQVRNTASRLFRVRWDNDGNGVADGEVTGTPEHPFWTLEQGWTPAGEIRVGMNLKTSFGNHAVVLEASKQLGETITYNLDVDGPDTFFVASQPGESVLVHNNNRDTYPYNQYVADGITKGSSYIAKWDKVNQVWYEDTSREMVANQQHHFFGDAWLRDNWAPEYRAKFDPFPCIELTNIDHARLEQAMRQWYADNLGFRYANGNPRYPQRGEWKSVSIANMRRAAKHAAATIGIPDKKIHQLSNMSLGYIRKHFTHYGCMNNN